jgi:hypothetical protein
MRRSLKFLKLSKSDQLLFLSCFFVVAKFRIGLSIVGYTRLSRKTAKRQRNGLSRTPENIIWGVRSAARFVPYASCLTQAISAQYLCARSGVETSIRIGVVPTGGQRFSAHAWLLRGDEILLGGSPADLSKFQVLTDLRLDPT